ncbi:MAG TPA: hypothetical protein VMT52_05040 [Planctomycetota bacterium]|nr:hypothetical protein [Planctomycetota bacterium]
MIPRARRKMTRGRRATATAASVAFLLLALAACSPRAQKPDRRGPFGLAAPAWLERLRDAHGGAAAWKRQGAVRFAYRITGPALRAPVELPEVAFFLEDFRHVWIVPPDGQRNPGGAARPISIDISLPPGAVAAAVEAARVGGAAPAWSEGERALVDYALRSIRYFLELPLATSTGRWSLQSLLMPPDVVAPPEIEVKPLARGSPLGPCRLYIDPRTGLLSRVSYVGLHPLVSRALHQVTFEGYERVSGIAIAGRRAHTALERAVGEPVTGAGAGVPARNRVLEEEVSGVRFLAPGEAAARYVAEEPVEGAPESEG